MDNQVSSGLSQQQAVELALAKRDAEAAKKQVGELAEEVRRLANELREFQGRTGLFSPSLLTRAFSVWGHLLVAQLIITIVLGGLYLLVVVVILAGS